MKSPFPGMDPYIETCGLWGDFHTHLIERIYDAIAEAAPERYVVRTGERSYLVLMDAEGKEEHPFTPDVKVTAPEGEKKPRKKKGGAAVAEPAGEIEPLTLCAFVDEEHRESFVEIYETGSGTEPRLVACIEVLSPSNKRPNTPGWEQYQRKRQSLMVGGVHLIEIDLLRGGQRMPMRDAWPDSPYLLMVARALKAPKYCRVWPAYFHRPLPPIPVPLLKPDADLSLDLQPMVEAIYERSRYERSIDYTRPLDPPLDSEEAAWLKQQLKAQRKES
jgi:hypothetical protein